MIIAIPTGPEPTPTGATPCATPLVGCAAHDGYHSVGQCDTAAVAERRVSRDRPPRGGPLTAVIDALHDVGMLAYRDTTDAEVAALTDSSEAPDEAQF